MNHQGNNNKLLHEYQNFNQNIGSSINNQLLQNNPVFANNMQYANSTQLLQMQRMQQMQQVQMQKLKESQQMKQYEKNNNQPTLEKIRESVIKPLKLNEKSKKDRQELEGKWKMAENNYMDKTGKNFGPEIQKYWKARTNEPYKNILKNESYSKNFKSKDDLVVHRVTVKDKEGVDDEFKKMDNNRERHDGELKVIYSTNHKSEHKKKFEYNHVYKYRVQYDPKSHGELKQDKIKYYKELQKKEEDKKQIRDSILECLITDGIFSQDELNSIDLCKKSVSDNESSDSVINSNIMDSVNDKKNNMSKKEAYLNRKNKH